MSDETFSAALIANLVAGNLQHVDDNMTEKSALGPAKKINPKRFLPAQVMQAEAAQVQERERRMMQELSRQAMQTHPHSGESLQPIQHTSPPHRVTVNTQNTSDFTDVVKILKSIDTTFKKLAKHIIDSK